MKNFAYRQWLLDFDRVDALHSSDPPHHPLIPEETSKSQDAN